MELWGLTGLAGSGKSLALKLLTKHGAAGVDSDLLAREVVDPVNELGRASLREIREAFGDDIVDPASGMLRRRELRDRIVAHPADQLRLERILHPKILRRLESWRRLMAPTARLGVVEGTRLVESGYADGLDGMILVTAPAAERLTRLRQRDGLSHEQATALLAAQNEDLMRKFATVEWRNDGGLDALEAQIVEFMQRAPGVKT